MKTMDIVYVKKILRTCLDGEATDYEQKANLLMAEYNQIPATITAQEKRQLVVDLLSKQNVNALLQ